MHWLVSRSVRLLTALLLLAPALYGAAQNPHGEILWDTWGTPHIYGKTVPAMFYGYGYAQAQAHGNLLLHLYAETRARAAEYFGPKYVESDIYLSSNDVYERAQEWYGKQSPQIKSYLDAFAEGINAYGKEHGDQLDPEVRAVLPVSGVDVMAHWERVMLFQYLASEQKVFGQGNTVGLARELEERDSVGSNAWAIAPKKSASGHSMLLMNPHLTWSPSWMTYFEVQLEAPGIHLYGATQVGLPVLRFCFNDHHGITNTVDYISAATLYKLTPQGEGYLLDGQEVAFTKTTKSIKVRVSSRTTEQRTFEVRQSVFGPVFTQHNGTTVALRVPGLDRAFGIEQYWLMDTAPDFAAYQKQLARLQVPSFNITYADRDGHIMYLFNGYMPVRDHGDYSYWEKLVPGDTIKNMWTRIHPYEDLPKVIDPPAGWVMNVNNAPWISTALPAMDPANFTPYVNPTNVFSFRAQQSVALLESKSKFTFEEFIEAKHSTRVLMADRLLPKLFAAAANSNNETVKKAVAVLKAWNRYDDADARGALLFETWASLFAGKAFTSQENFDVKWSFSDPFHTPRGLKDPQKAVAMLEEAANQCIKLYGSIDRPFGDVSRFHWGEYNVPGNGGFGSSGIFRVITWSPMKNGERIPVHGETFFSIIEFGKTRARAVSAIGYGESTQPGSKHTGDQVQLLTEKKMKPVWRSRTELNGHTESTTIY